MLKRALQVLVAITMSLAMGVAAFPEDARADDPPPRAAMVPSLYNQPGDHYVNGRFWKTECEMYSTNVVRCSTNIWATKIVQHNGTYYNHNGWVFNNLTYLPSDEAQWSGNRLAFTNEWTATDGRKWKTECNTPQTGQGGCRSYAWATLVSNQGTKFIKTEGWSFNNILQFSTATLAPQTTILPRTANLPNMPVEKEFVPPKAKPNPKPSTPPSSFKADSRCKTGRALCVSKDQRKMAWMIDGEIIKTFDVRFGSPKTPTRNGSRTVLWKSRNHVSKLYNSSMPFAMFFDGGQAVHYSSDFARNGYSGASHGCVNVRDYDGIKWLFDEVRTGDKVIVYN